LDDATRKRLLSILDEMPDDQLTLAIRLGLGAGLRNEEALGLQWENVNLHDGVVKVRNCICMAGGKVVEKGPETSAGRRDVPIDPNLVKRLRTRARTVFGTQKLSKPQGFYVLGDTEGHYYGHHALSRAFRDSADKWEIYGTTGELATFYSLRHTYATMLLRAGVDAKTVASLIGHSSVAMTLNVYASTDPQAKAAAGAVVANLMTQR
jgi:integrase